MSMSWWCSSCSFCCWYVVVDVDVEFNVVFFFFFFFSFVFHMYFPSLFSVLFDKRQKKKKNCMCEATWATKKWTNFPIVGRISRKKSLQSINLPEMSKTWHVCIGYFRKLIVAREFLDEWEWDVLAHIWWKGSTNTSRKCTEHLVFCWWTYDREYENSGPD